MNAKNLPENHHSHVGRPASSKPSTGSGTGSKTTKRLSQPHFLGEIGAQIVGLQYHEGPIEPGQHVELEREPDNPHDPLAIRVDNDHRQAVGYLSRKVNHWLSPLIDSGKVRAEAYVPGGPSTTEEDKTKLPLVLMVFLTAKGQSLFRTPANESRLDLLHSVVLGAYHDARRCSDPQLIDGLADGLAPLLQQDLLLESKLLLSLIPGIVKELLAARGVGALATLKAALEQVQIGKPLVDRGLTIFPLSWPDAHEPPYVLLSRAIAIGTAVVEEISQNGSVPHLCVHNKGLRPLLIPEGEILVGAKQNRVVNVTVLVAAKTTFTLPVSCVERGRWQYRSKAFTCQCNAPPSLRSKKLRSVLASRREQGQSMSDQGEVWDEVDRCLADVQVASPTASLTDALARSSEHLAQTGPELRLPDNTAGVIVGHDCRLIGMDLFDAPATLQEVWPRLRAAYGLDGLRGHLGDRPLLPELASLTFDVIAKRAQAAKTALGLGEHLEVCGGGLIGAGLIYSGKICHLAAFAESAEPEK